MSDVEWSQWVPFAEALAHAPRVPGVYMAREGEVGDIVYIGMAGERSGGKKPQGIRGRLATYARGKALASGLGEAVLDRALADPAWVRARLADLESNGPRRAKYWGIEAFVRADLWIRWTVTEDRASAAALEDQLVRAAGATLWNKASFRLSPSPIPTTRSPRLASTEPAANDGGPRTQRITTVDLAKGRIRIPIAFKSLFPTDRTDLPIILCGENVVCRWDPRLGPDKQRSGVLRPPKNALRLISEDARLIIAVEGTHLALG